MSTLSADQFSGLEDYANTYGESSVIRNPLPKPPDSLPGPYIGEGWTAEEEWVPTYNVTSQQPFVRDASIKHQVKHANPMALEEQPELIPYQHEGEEHYRLTDGNHRTNAALERGQMLMPAMVWRDRRPKP